MLSIDFTYDFTYMIGVSIPTNDHKQISIHKWNIEVHVYNVYQGYIISYQLKGKKSICIFKVASPNE